MSDHKNLFNREGIEKIKELTEEANITVFCTNLSNKPFSATPMAVQAVEDDGAIYYFSGKDSERNAHLRQDPATQIIVSNNSDYEYLSLYGTSTVSQDRAKIKELWSADAKVWFQDGPEDPNLTLIRFEPTDGYYWDNKHGKLVAFAKMAASLITGKTMDDGIQGKIKV